MNAKIQERKHYSVIHNRTASFSGRMPKSKGSTTLASHAITKTTSFSKRMLKSKGLKQGFANLKSVAAAATGHTMQSIVAYQSINGQPCCATFTNGITEFRYTNVWRYSNMEENMDIDLRNIHPNIRLIAPDKDEGLSYGAARATSSVRMLKKFKRFNNLLIQIQLRIFRFMLKMDGYLIHVFS